jgi:tetratricopeptide (TPR) repeat protein
LALPLFQQGRHEEAEEAARTAVRTLEPLGEGEALADALHMLGWFLWRRGREEEAEPLLRRAVDIATDAGAELVRAEATQTLAVCLTSSGKTAESNRMMLEAFRLAKEVGYLANLMRAYNNVANTMSEQDLAEAEAVLREGLELALRAGTRANAAWIMGSLGDTVYRLGRLEEAEGYMRGAYELASEVHDEPLAGQRVMALAFPVLFRGRAEEARALIAQAQPLLDANPEPQAQMYPPQLEGYFALERRDDVAAAERFAESLELTVAYNVDVLPEIFPELVRVLLRLGDRERAERYRSLSDLDGSAITATQGRLVEALLEPDPVAAASQLRAVVEALRGHSLHLDEARAMGDLGRAMARAGEDPREVLTRARALLLECDARLFLPEVDDALAELDR